MSLKPYAGEKIIHKRCKGSWWGPGEIGIGEALFLDPMAQQRIRNGTYHQGVVWITNIRLIFQGDDRSKECIVYLEQANTFRYKPGGWLTYPTLYVKKDDGSEETIMIEGAPSRITTDLYHARETAIHTKAIQCEKHLDYNQAITLWEKLRKPQEAARVRRFLTEQNTVKVDQTVVHGNYVDDRDTTYVDDRDTIIKDSVVSKSNVGAGGDDKFARLEKLAEMKENGLIDDDEFKQMKKEILGK